MSEMRSEQVNSLAIYLQRAAKCYYQFSSCKVYLNEKGEMLIYHRSFRSTHPAPTVINYEQTEMEYKRNGRQWRYTSNR